MTDKQLERLLSCLYIIIFQLGVIGGLLLSRLK